MEPVELEIRPLSDDELGELPELWDLAGLHHDALGRDARTALERQRLAAPDLSLGAFARGRLVGVVLGSDDGRKGWINRLAVHPEWRRRGVARRLLAACEGALAHRGRTIIGALVHEPNDGSVSLFEEVGYTSRSDIRYFRRILPPGPGREG